MPIAIVCPSCNRKLQAPDRMAGKKVNCPKCRETLAVPVLTPTPSSKSPSKPSLPNRVKGERDTAEVGVLPVDERHQEDDDAADEQEIVRGRHLKKSANLLWIVLPVAGAVCITAVAAAVVITVLVMKDNQKPTPQPVPQVAQQAPIAVDTERQRKAEADARAAREAADHLQREQAAAKAKSDTEAQAKKVEADAKAKAEIARKVEEEAKRRKAIEETNAKLSRANYDKIRPPFYLPDVIDLFGPSSEETLDGEYKWVTWRSTSLEGQKSVVIRVRFRNATGRTDRYGWMYNGSKSYD